MLAALVRPGGLAVFSTINRTFKPGRWPSSAPNTCSAGCRAARISGSASSRRRSWSAISQRAGFGAPQFSGLVYDVMHDEWKLDAGDLGVNYLASAALAR